MSPRGVLIGVALTFGLGFAVGQSVNEPEVITKEVEVRLPGKTKIERVEVPVQVPLPEACRSAILRLEGIKSDDSIIADETSIITMAAPDMQYASVRRQPEEMARLVETMKGAQNNLDVVISRRSANIEAALGFYETCLNDLPRSGP